MLDNSSWYALHHHHHCIYVVHKQGFLPIQLSFEVVHADLDESDDKIAKAIQLYRQSATIFVINNNNSKSKKRPNDAIGRKVHHHRHATN